jgi:hypothetical protein
MLKVTGNLGNVNDDAHLMLTIDCPNSRMKELGARTQAQFQIRIVGGKTVENIMVNIMHSNNPMLDTTTFFYICGMGNFSKPDFL